MRRNEHMNKDTRGEKEKMIASKVVNLVIKENTVQMYRALSDLSVIQEQRRERA